MLFDDRLCTNENNSSTSAREDLQPRLLTSVSPLISLRRFYCFLLRLSRYSCCSN